MKTKYFKNEFDVAIRVWCASCQHKDITRAYTLRHCRLLNKDVKPDGMCRRWKLTDQLKMVGKEAKL
jgi:hypothetical protein